MNEHQKNLAIFDIDDTIINGQTQRLFIDYLHKTGVVSHTYYIKILLWFILYKLGLIKDPRNIMRTAFLFLRGVPKSDLLAITDSFYRDILCKRIYSEALLEIEKYRNQGDDLMLLSNAAHPIVEKISEKLGVPQFLSTRLELDGDVFTGKIKGDSVYGENKLQRLKSYLSDKTYIKIYGYADHPSDYDFLNFVDEAYVVNPNKKMVKIANNNGWKILKF